MTTQVHDLFPLEEIEAGSARKVQVGDHAIVIVRIDDDVYALGDTCSHEEVSLSEGFVDEDECLIECWRHGAMFDLRTGQPETLPAVRPVPVYDVEVVDGRVRIRIESGTDNGTSGGGIGDE